MLLNGIPRNFQGNRARSTGIRTNSIDINVIFGNKYRYDNLLVACARFSPLVCIAFAKNAISFTLFLEEAHEKHVPENLCSAVTSTWESLIKTSAKRENIYSPILFLHVSDPVLLLRRPRKTQ